VTQPNAPLPLGAIPNCSQQPAAKSEKPLRCRHLSPFLRQVICPTGNFRKFLSSPFAKNICLPFFGNLWHVSPYPVSVQGALRPIVAEREVGCGGRDGACDERLRLRTVKPCGSGAPKQASSSRDANASRE